MPDPLLRGCDRCSAPYRVDPSGKPSASSPCRYHWGKLYMRGRQLAGKTVKAYSCCGGRPDAPGCCRGATHVSETAPAQILKGYARTGRAGAGALPVLALDCEMCYAYEGKPVARVTLVDHRGRVVFDAVVRPSSPLLDPNTRFTGLSRQDLDRATTTLAQVHRKLLELVAESSVLVGHSLEHDLTSLRLLHGTVVDTSVVFGHPWGRPHKRALRSLARDHLGKTIQRGRGRTSGAGHDSTEDAVTCMELMRWKVHQDLQRGPGAGRVASAPPNQWNRRTNYQTRTVGLRPLWF